MTDVALIFPGQGSQSVGMGKEFYEGSEVARAVFDKAEQAINGLIDVMFNGPQEKLTSTVFCQPAIFSYSMAALEALKQSDAFKECSVKYVAGLSLGEVSALGASGALDFENSLKLVSCRAALMEDATKLEKGAMAAVIGMEKNALVGVCQEAGCEVANFNTPEQIVITGKADAVALACEKIKNAGVKRVIPLEVSGAFHCGLMRSASDNFKEELKLFPFTDAEIPIVTNVDARPYAKATEIQANLASQIVSSVQWVDSVEFMAAQGVTRFIEIGPGNVLKGLIRKINSGLKVFNVRKPEDIAGLDFNS